MVRATNQLIYVLEDDRESQFVYDQILGPRYRLQMFEQLSSLRTGLENPSDGRPELIIADLRLPDGILTQFLSTIERPLIDQIPIIVVSSVDDLDIVRNCFEFGAHDYLTKPFGRGELIVKLERILSKQDKTRVDTLFSLNPATMTVDRGHSQSMVLTMKEFQIMNVFQKAGMHGVTRHDILDTVWRGVKVTPKTFDVHLFNLRRKLHTVHLEVRFTPPQQYGIIDIQKQAAII